MDLKWQRSTTKFVIRLPQGNKQLISFPKKSFWTNVSSWLSLKAHQSQQVTANSFWTATSNLPPTTSTGRGTDHGNQLSLGPSCKLPSEKIQDALLAMRWRHTEGLRSTPKLRQLYRNKKSEEKNLHCNTRHSQKHSEQTHSLQKRFALHCPYCTREKQRLPGQGWGSIIAAQLLFVNHPVLDKVVNPSHLRGWFRKKLP